MQAVKSPFVLLLEKDWKLVESRATVFKQLDLAKRLMFSRQNGSRADLVKFRSRWNFGFPNVSPRKTVPPDWDIGVSMVVVLLPSIHSRQPDRSPVTSHTVPGTDSGELGAAPVLQHLPLPKRRGALEPLSQQVHRRNCGYSCGTVEFVMELVSCGAPTNDTTRMWRCGCDFNYWCFDSGQCGWTNNPIMFQRKWWLDMMVRHSGLTPSIQCAPSAACD
jgi:hypothetical protein